MDPPSFSFFLAPFRAAISYYMLWFDPIDVPLDPNVVAMRMRMYQTASSNPDTMTINIWADKACSPGWLSLNE